MIIWPYQYLLLAGINASTTQAISEEPFPAGLNDFIWVL